MLLTLRVNPADSGHTLPRPHGAWVLGFSRIRRDFAEWSAVGLAVLFNQCSILLGKCVCRMLIQAPTGVHRGSDCLGFLSLGTSLPQTLPPNPGHVTVCR